MVKYMAVMMRAKAVNDAYEARIREIEAECIQTKCDSTECIIISDWNKEKLQAVFFTKFNHRIISVNGG